jgi:hypothetical protein
MNWIGTGSVHLPDRSYLFVAWPLSDFGVSLVRIRVSMSPSCNVGRQHNDSGPFFTRNPGVRVVDVTSDTERHGLSVAR